tara:strand:+ start:1146 stop:2561 length:1416 start_codon:yes stop_codon:yes gene_type:complete
MRIKYYIISILLVILLGLFFLTIKNTKDNIDNKSNQIEFLENSLKTKKTQLKNIHEKLIEDNIYLEDVILKQGIKFDNKSTREITFDDNNFEFTEFYTNDIVFAKHPSASSSAYLESDNENFYLVTATGQFVYSNLSNLSKEKFLMNKINSNIKDIISYKDFFTSSPFGIKDILIHENKIYVSFIKEVTIDCYNTSIIYAEVNLNYLNFSEFFSTNECVNKNDSFFNTNKHDHIVPHQSGGRMININNKIIFTVGEFRLRVLAQNKDSIFGKIVAIDINNRSNYEIISLGHRNPQGLFYDKELKKIFSTEHGPSGGDEINVINYDKDNNNKIFNYGWPLASYGKHYFEEKNDTRLELSPLNKSHSKNGFIEPIKYFDPSVGISQIIGIPDKLIDSNYKNFIVGTMGTAKKLKEGMLSLFLFEYDNLNNKIISSKLVPLKSRVRDMVYLNSEELILMFLETNSSVAIFKKKG